MEIAHFKLLICKRRPRNILRLLLLFKLLFGDIVVAVAVAVVVVFSVRFLTNVNRATTRQESELVCHNYDKLYNSILV